jgi:hypothetical protein
VIEPRNDDTDDAVVGEQDLRAQAVARLKGRRKFRRDVAIYVVVNAALWGIWAINGAKTDDLWPAWVAGIWGFLLLLDAWKVYAERPISEREIEDEVSRMRNRP